MRQACGAAVCRAGGWQLHRAGHRFATDGTAIAAGGHRAIEQLGDLGFGTLQQEAAANGRGQITALLQAFRPGFAEVRGKRHGGGVAWRLQEQQQQLVQLPLFETVEFVGFYPWR